MSFNENKLERIYGKNRYDTAVKIANWSYEYGVESVVLVHKDKYTDSLTAIPFAKLVDAPILYTDTEYTPNQTIEALKKLGVKRIYIIGGKNTISSKQENNLFNMGYVIDRIGGVNRYETAELIANRIKEKTIYNNNDVILASGENFPDALSASSLAIKNNIPILLSRGDSLPDNLARYKKNTFKGKIYIIGGLNSISSDVEKTLKYTTKGSITRFAGKNRYETSVLVAKAARYNPDTIVFASGEIYQDALLSGGLLYENKAPLILLRRDSMPDEVDHYLMQGMLNNAIIVGGKNTISEEVEGEIRNFL